MFTQSTKPFYLTAVVVALLIMAGSPVVNAQTKDTKSKLSPDKKWAMEFKFRSLTSLESFLFAGKRQLTKNSALRFGVEIDAFDRNTDSDVERLTYNDTSDYKNGLIYSNIDITVCTQYILYSSLKEDLRLYYGTGPQFNYRKSENEDERLEIQGHYHKIENKYKGIGLSSVFGIEWFVAKNIAFLAEYGVTFEYLKVESEDIRTDNDGDYRLKRVSEEDRFSFDGSEAKFGLAFYF